MHCLGSSAAAAILLATAFVWQSAFANPMPAGGALAGERPRVIVSTDIGGSDPDDFQSMIHFLLYADVLDVEGLISSPPDQGRAAHLHEAIDAYEQDFPNLRRHSADYPAPDKLRATVKQGATDPSPPQGFGEPTEGSRWLIERAKAADERPLYVLVWGSITDVAQAVHDDPSIKSRLRVYAIGSWNTGQDRSARNYLYEQHPDLWWIESDGTFRGMYVGGDQEGDLHNRAFVDTHVQGHGALGQLFRDKLPAIKMGDTPSFLYLLRGDADDPTGEHWGGSFVATEHGPHYWTDSPDPALAEGRYPGAKTVNRWREDFLRDWAGRMDRVLQPEVSSGDVRGEIVLSRASNAWMSQQIEEPCILPNPKVPGRLIMFYGAVPASNRNTAAIGKAWADAKDPFTWHQDEANPIFKPAAQGWDSGSIRLDTVLYIPEEDAYYIYYSGPTGNVQDRIGLAICPAGDDGYSGVTSDAIARYGTGPVLAPEGAAPYHEEMASQAGVLREWNEAAKAWDWYLYYSYRGKDGVLPGIRLATSRDGRNWTRHFNADDPRGMGHIFESTPNAYYEWHQAFKLGSTYVLCIELGVEHGARWRPALAVSTDPVKGWAQLDPDTVLQTKWGKIYDDRTMYHVATPALYQIEGEWYLFTQACGGAPDQHYIDGAWEMWAFTCDRVIPTRPGCADLHIPGLPAAAEPGATK